MVENITSASNVVSEKTRKDMLFSQIGVNLMYFASERFNFNANYKNYNIQRKSALTFVATGGYNYYHLDGRLNLIDNIYNENSLISNFYEYSVRVLPGIAFSIVYKKFYISMLGLMGVGINKNIVEVNDVKNYYSNYTPAFESIAALGYNSRDFFVSLIYSVENDHSRIDNLYLGASHTTMALKVGKKIEVKYLGKWGKYL